MKAEELRIGNYVIDYEAEPETTIYWQVEEIQRLSNDKALNQTIGVTYRNGSCWSCDIKPIPLTEDWLLNFGFKYNGFCYEFNKHEVRLINEFNIPYWIDSNFITNISYVHQLQNLYYALTNKELNYER